MWYQVVPWYQELACAFVRQLSTPGSALQAYGQAPPSHCIVAQGAGGKARSGAAEGTMNMQIPGGDRLHLFLKCAAGVGKAQILLL